MPKGYFKPFTKQDEQFIKDNFLLLPVKQIAKKLDASWGRVMRFLKNNNLEIPKELIEQRRLEGRKQKGDIPFNKGLKQSEYMSKEGIERTKGTRFKKGRKPHNTKQKGQIVSIKDSHNDLTYKYIKIKDNNWVLYHKYLWEKVNGKIPDNLILRFKDGDTNNVNIDNLELITRTENMYRNSRHNYPVEIIPSLVLIKKLEHKLKDLQND